VPTSAQRPAPCALPSASPTSPSDRRSALTRCRDSGHRPPQVRRRHTAGLRQQRNGQCAPGQPSDLQIMHLPRSGQRAEQTNRPCERAVLQHRKTEFSESPPSAGTPGNPSVKSSTQRPLGGDSENSPAIKRDPRDRSEPLDSERWRAERSSTAYCGA
jgi:hypothetical protein